MKNKTFIALLMMMAMLFVSSESFAQNKKADKKAAKQEKRVAQFNEKITSVTNMVENKMFRFSVFSIDAKASPQLSHIQLKGGYMLTVKGGELTVELPLMGPNVRRGNASGALSKMNFVTTNFKIGMTRNPEDGTLYVKIFAVDQVSKNEYSFLMSVSTSDETLNVSTSGVDDVTYKGHFAAAK